MTDTPTPKTSIKVHPDTHAALSALAVLMTTGKPRPVTMREALQTAIAEATAKREKRGKGA